MTLLLIGVGIGSIRDISVRAKEALQLCTHVFLESYTSILPESKEEMETFLGKPLIMASRTMVEQDAQEILVPAKSGDVAFLVVGDAFGATTHVDLLLRAREQGIDVRVYHNASILTAVGVTGLELYKFGKTTSLVFFDEHWKPETAYDAIKENRAAGLHTLVLLDIKIAEPSRSDLLKGKQVAAAPRFMSIKEAIAQLLSIEEKRKESVFTASTLVVGCARLGSERPTIGAGAAADVALMDFGAPLHCLIVPGVLHFMEEDALRLYPVR